MYTNFRSNHPPNCHRRKSTVVFLPEQQIRWSITRTPPPLNQVALSAKRLTCTVNETKGDGVPTSNTLKQDYCCTSTPGCERTHECNCGTRTTQFIALNFSSEGTFWYRTPHTPPSKADETDTANRRQRTSRAAKNQTLETHITQNSHIHRESTQQVKYRPKR